MKALLLNDWYVTKKYLRLSLIVAALFSVMGVFQSGTVFFIFPMIFAAALPMSLISYDEAFRWHRYAEILPISRKSYVSEKYVFALLATLSFVLFMLICQLTASLFGHTPELFFAMLPVIVTAGLMFPAITMPFMLRYGVEKGRLAYYVCIGVLCGLSVLISGGNATVSRLEELPLVFMPLAAAVIFAVSWLLAIKFYEKREL